MSEHTTTPTRDETADVLRKLIVGELSPEAASEWASAWIERSELVGDVRVLRAIEAIGGADLPSTDRHYLFGKADFEKWLDELTAGGTGQSILGHEAMTTHELANQLQHIATSNDFPSSSSMLVEEWSAIGVGSEAVEPVLRFMEAHPDIDFGTPGALVHFVERFRGRDYTAHLVESVQRKPMSITVWMLNRVINGENEADSKDHLIAVMRQVSHNPFADAEAKDLAEQLLVSRGR